MALRRIVEYILSLEYVRKYEILSFHKHDIRRKQNTNQTDAVGYNVINRSDVFNDEYLQSLGPCERSRSTVRYRFGNRNRFGIIILRKVKNHCRTGMFMFKKSVGTSVQYESCR